MSIRATVACALVLGAGFDASAQKVYRCGPDGRTYQQTACADGKAVDASDPRSAEQQQAAQALAKSEAKAAAQFDRDAQGTPTAKGGKAAAAPNSATKGKAASDVSAAAEQAQKKAEQKAAKQAAADAKAQLILLPVAKPKGAASAAK